MLFSRAKLAAERALSEPNLMEGYSADSSSNTGAAFLQYPQPSEYTNTMLGAAEARSALASCSAANLATPGLGPTPPARKAARWLPPPLLMDVFTSGVTGVTGVSASGVIGMAGVTAGSFTTMILVGSTIGTPFQHAMPMPPKTRKNNKISTTPSTMLTISSPPPPPRSFLPLFPLPAPPFIF